MSHCCLPLLLFLFILCINQFLMSLLFGHFECIFLCFGSFQFSFGDHLPLSFSVCDDFCFSCLNFSSFGLGGGLYLSLLSIESLLFQFCMFYSSSPVVCMLTCCKLFSLEYAKFFPEWLEFDVLLLVFLSGSTHVLIDTKLIILELPECALALEQHNPDSFSLLNDLFVQLSLLVVLFGWLGLGFKQHLAH